LAVVLGVVCPDPFGEAAHQLAIADQEQVIIDRESLEDQLEEGPQVLLSPAVALVVMLRRRVAGGAMAGWHTRLDAAAPGELRAPAHKPGRVCRDPDARGAAIRHRTSLKTRVALPRSRDWSLRRRLGLTRQHLLIAALGRACQPDVQTDPDRDSECSSEC
jgi:hypothetical protein